MQDNFREINDFIQEKMQSTNLPALSLAIYQDGDIIYSRGYGRKDLSTGEPATPKTLYGIGSITKSFVALAIMQLHEERHLDINDDIDQYLGLNIKPFDQNIKIKNLMDHTSGIPSLGFAYSAICKVIGGQTDDLPIGTCQDMVDYMKGTSEWVESSPGKRWFYSNETYVLLGGIIEKVTGMTVSDYIEENIFNPLNMNDSIYTREDFLNHEDTAQPYIINKDGSRDPGDYLYGNAFSNGNIISNVLDLIKYLKLYISPEPSIISRKSLDLMMQPHIEMPLYKTYYQNNQDIELDFNSEDSSKYYGYGLIINPDFYGHRLVGHGGSVLTSTAQFDFIPKLNIGLAILANGSGYSKSNISKYILALLLDKDPDKLDFRYSETRFENLTGQYEAYTDDLIANITRQGDLLNCEMGIGDTKSNMTLIPESISKNSLKFFSLQNGSKQPAEFKIKENEIEFIFERYKFKK